MNHEAKACGCTQDIGMSRAHIPHYCKHGHLLTYTKTLGRSVASGTRRSVERRRPISAASKAQREKVRGLPCAHCGAVDGVLKYGVPMPIDPAHLWPRGKGGCDSAKCVVPLCRWCHREFDEGKLELLPALIDRGYFEEMAHPIAVHQVSPTQLVDRLTVSAYTREGIAKEVEAA